MYKFNITVNLIIKDVEDTYEALNYAEQWVSDGLAMISNSDDPQDDHYELVSATITQMEEC